MKTWKLSLLFLGLIAATAISAQAHTLRVLVTRPVTQPGFKSTVFLSYGHLLPIDEVIAANEVGPYQIHTPAGSIKPLELAGNSMHAQEITCDEPGMYQVAVIRKPIIYVAYTEASGKQVFARLPKNQAQLPDGAKLTASARSSQFSKAVMLHEISDGQATPALGHTLEILIESKPGKLGYSADEPIRAQVLFRGKPLAGVKVSAASTSRNPDGIPAVAGETDAEGRVALELVEPGTWLLDVLHLIDSSPADRAAFDNERFAATTSIPVTDK